MEAQRPILVARDIETAEQIRGGLRPPTGQQVRMCNYKSCRDQIAWHKNGLIALVVSAEDDAAEAMSILREIGLRRSPVKTVVVYRGPASEPIAHLDASLSCQLRWPEDVDGLTAIFRTAPKVAAKDETLAEILASRLASHTPSLLPQVNRFAVAAAHDITVLLTGQTGTGKTYLARLLHEHSSRRNHPFLMVPCGAQPSNLFESTFFGHVKGAYTGAHQSRVGRFAAAGHGTILLDEIDALGLEQQASLLRVIETGEYEAVGGNETQRSDARIIVASNTDLSEEVAKGRFRQDLFYRLNVMSFHLPPLCKRRQDIPLLARSIVARYNTKFDKRLVDISTDAMAMLEAYPWPGNIRQLENALQSAVLISSANELRVTDFPDLPAGDEETQPFSGALVAAPANVISNHSYADVQAGASGRVPGANGSAGETLFSGRVSFERGLIQQTLFECRNNRSRAARALGISRVTLYKKLKQYGLIDLPPR